MNEITRLKQLAGINEIKVNNPNKHFTITPKGKQMMEDYNTFWVAARNLGAGDMIYEIDEIDRQYPQLLALSHLNILSDNYGEGIIKMNDKNNLDQVIKDYTTQIGDKEDVINQLKIFKKYGYITDINI